MRTAAAVVLAALAAMMAHTSWAVTGNDIISTVAGNGSAGFSGDGGSATAAQLFGPSGVAADGAGNIYVADEDNKRVRKVTPGGVITTIAGTGTAGSAGDGGQATSAQLNVPIDVAVDGAGNVYVAEQVGNRVRRIAPDGVITTVAGTGVVGFSGDGLAATGAMLANPAGLGTDAAGNLYIADLLNHRIRRVSTSGIITTIAGTGTAGFSGDGGQATSAQLNNPFDVAVDAAGNVYIADGTHRVRKVSVSGMITTIAGTGSPGFSGDGGQATSAQLTAPQRVAVGPDGTVYVTDSGSRRVRAITAGTITTVAGNGVAGFSGDGGPAIAASLTAPGGLAVDVSGNLLVTDIGRPSVRKVTAPAAPAAPATPAADTAVSADVIGAVAGKNPNGRRVVRLELSLDETVSATLTLRRGTRTLATKQFASVAAGKQVLTIRVPPGTAKGKATLAYELRDGTGNVLRGRLGVRIGRAVQTRVPLAGLAGPDAAALLARTQECDRISNGFYKTDVERRRTIAVCDAGGAVWWRADMDVDCDGKPTPRCNLRADPAFQPATAFQQSNGRQLVADRSHFIVVPSTSRTWNWVSSGLRGGGSCAVVYDSQVLYAVIGDTGPKDIIGEASYATARDLGIDPDPATGGSDGPVTYICFKGSRVAPIESNARATEVGEALAAAFVEAP
jgi:sugar lactone lactonase YvrE